MTWGREESQVDYRIEGIRQFAGAFELFIDVPYKFLRCGKVTLLKQFSRDPASRIIDIVVAKRFVKHTHSVTNIGVHVN